MDKTSFKIGCYAICCCVITTIVVICIALSISDVQEDEICIAWNRWGSHKVEQGTYEVGKYFLDPTASFICYPRKAQKLEWIGSNQITCQTGEGLTMTLAITTQYQIDKVDLHKVLNTYGENEAHRTYLSSVTRDSIKYSCSMFNGTDYFLRRGQIQQKMFDILGLDYIRSAGLATLLLLQVQNVAHPPSYKAKNDEAQVVLTENQRLIGAREQVLISAQTDLLKAEKDAEILMIQANATAQGHIKQAEALVSAVMSKWNDRASALKNIKDGLGSVSTESFINHFIRYDVLSHTQGVVFGLSKDQKP